MTQRNAEMWERRDRIKDYLRKSKTPLTVTALADSEFQVSRATILQDLRDMEYNGEVQRYGRTEWAGSNTP